MKWTKKCKCENYIPDEYSLCDSCLLKRFNLFMKGRYDSEDMVGLGGQLYPEEDVIKALRKAIGEESK